MVRPRGFVGGIPSGEEWCEGGGGKSKVKEGWSSYPAEREPGIDPRGVQHGEAPCVCYGKERIRGQELPPGDRSARVGGVVVDVEVTGH